MYIGKSVLIKHNGELVEGVVETIHEEDLEIRLLNGELINRKWWEVGQIKLENE
jgi:hypothetical protein